MDIEPRRELIAPHAYDPEGDDSLPFADYRPCRRCGGVYRDDQHAAPEQDRELVRLNPLVWDGEQAGRDRCAAGDHRPLTFNPMLDRTFCRCGAARYPANRGRIDPETTPPQRHTWSTHGPGR